MRKFLGMSILSLGVSFATIVFIQPSFLKTNIEAEIVERIWRKDIRMLERAGQLPQSWQEIGELRLNPLSPRAATWLNNIQVPIKYKEQGRYRLDISLDHNEEKDSIAIISQYHLIDSKSGNSLWEFGRTYIIPNKKWIGRGQKILSFLKSFAPDQKEYSSVQPSPPPAPKEDHSETPN